MKVLKWVFLFVSFGMTSFGWAGSNENLNIILELESKITQKVRAILQPVDPDAIVIAKVEIQKINTELAGTQMSAVGIISTADVQTVEESDLQSISVSIISALDPFPEDIKKLIESTLRDFSRKGRVKIVKMTDSLSKAILQGNKNKSELLEKSKTGWQKTSELADQLSQLTKQIPNFADNFKRNILFLFLQILVFYSLIQGGILFFQKRFQGNSIQLLRDALSSISLTSSNKPSEESEAANTPMKLPAAPEGSSNSGNLNGSITTKDNPIEQMYIQLIRDLISDCYWCHKDHYAAWVWSQLSPPKRMELLESWEPIIYYVKYFTHLEPQTDNYHLDPIYLKPREYFMHSNEDLLAIVRNQPYLWGEISILRQKAFRITLKERIDFMKAANKARPEKPFEWPYTPSPLRVLHTQLEVTELSIDDEAMIIQDPNMVPDGYRDSLHSLIWTAMLPQEDRDKLLQKIPAQTLAEIWIGPEDALTRLNEVLPAKKQELLKSYLSRTTPNRAHPAMKYLSELSLKRFRELYPPPPEVAEVVISKMDLDRSPVAMADDNEQMLDVEALVAAFKEGKIDDAGEIITSESDAPRTESTDIEPSSTDSPGTEPSVANVTESKELPALAENVDDQTATDAASNVEAEGKDKKSA